MHAENVFSFFFISACPVVWGGGVSNQSYIAYPAAVQPWGVQGFTVVGVL